MSTTIGRSDVTGNAIETDVGARWAIGRVVAGSVAIGLVGALVLTLFVFPGAEEHVITGSVLLAFAAGWVALWLLSTRLTDQPQQWALVPAVAMAVVAFVLFAFSPGNGALKAAGWAWPPALAAITVWMLREARRDLRSKTRTWLLYPVFAALLLGSLGGAVEAVVGASEVSGPTEGRMVDVGGRRMYLNCSGSGSPTVILLNGLGEHSLSWAWITKALAPSTRVCAYDRAGQGWSDDAPNAPQDGVEVAADLHTLLDSGNVPEPYVLAGHSVGGTFALTYAAKYPGEVAGLTLLDSSSPHQFDMSWYRRFYFMYSRASALLPTLSRMALARPMFGTGAAGLPAEARSQERKFLSTPREMRSQRDEISQLRTVFEQARSLTSFGGKPLFVLAAGRGQEAGWFEAQDELAKLSTNSARRTARDSTHSALLDDESQARHSTAAILAVVESVRSSSPLSR